MDRDNFKKRTKKFQKTGKPVKNKRSEERKKEVGERMKRYWYEWNQRRWSIASSNRKNDNIRTLSGWPRWLRGGTRSLIATTSIIFIQPFVGRHCHLNLSCVYKVSDIRPGERGTIAAEFAESRRWILWVTDTIRITFNRIAQISETTFTKHVTDSADGEFILRVYNISSRFKRITVRVEKKNKYSTI